MYACSCVKKKHLHASTLSEHPSVRGKNVKITTSLVLSSMHLCDFASISQPPTLLQRTLQTPRGRYFGIVLWDAQGGVYSIFYGITALLYYVLRFRIEGLYVCLFVY